MRYHLEAIAQAVGEIVGWVDLPLVACPVVWLVEYTVRRKVPHLRVPIGDILLHAQECLPWLVLAIPHSTELLEVVFGGLVGMFAPETRAGSLFSPTLQLDLVVYYRCKYETGFL